MTAEEHNKTLATLYFVYGGIHGLTLIALLLLVLAVQTATSGGKLFGRGWMIWGGAVFVVLLLVVGILPVLVGYGFKKRKRWVKPAGIALAIPSMINIPIGTALGIYTLRFFRTPGGVSLYGGNRSTASEADLDHALHGTKPLMNLADRLK